MNRIITLIALLNLLLCFHESEAQTTQTIRGLVLDSESEVPLIGATVQLLDVSPIQGTTTDYNGDFVIENVLIGRVNLKVSYLGYETRTLGPIEVTAGKQVVLDIPLTESIASLEEVVVVAQTQTGEVANEMATVSTRQLSVLEANRYAASISDPARQAQNFAGVSGGGDDLSNDIVVRGNSPRGLLWRIEGIEVPNPNHFSGLGGSGGGVSMLSSNVLSNSDFFTGAFPAEYGNASSGIFDLKFRRGNRDKREFTIGAGFLGLEAAAEGPFKDGGKASYLVNYRFSTLGVLTALGVDVAGDVLPNYQDLSFNLDFPTAKAGRFSVFGLAGQNWYTSDFIDTDEDGTGAPITRTFAEESNALTTVVGLKHRYLLSDNAYVHTIVSGSRAEASEDIDRILNAGGTTPQFGESSTEEAVRFSQLWNFKLNARHTLRAGGIFNALSEGYTLSGIGDSTGFRNFLDFSERTTSFQSYLQWKWRINERLTANSGLHYFRYAFTNSQRLEPRAGLKFQLTPKHILTAGAGMHSRAESLIAYAAAVKLPDGTLVRPSEGLGLNRAAHLVLGYEWAINKQQRFKVETYYQELNDVPVSSRPNSRFSALNVRSSSPFVERGDTLINAGTGRNYGVEFTFERSLHKDYYYLATASLYDATYTTSKDGPRYNTLFNGGYVFNVLGGRDWHLGKADKNTFGVNLRATASGGLRYTPIDLAESQAAGTSVFSRTPFSAQNAGYFRLDAAANYTWNKTASTHTLSLSIQNVTNRLNEAERDERFDAASGQVRTRIFTQSGTIPILKYVVQF